MNIHIHIILLESKKTYKSTEKTDVDESFSVFSMLLGGNIQAAYRLSTHFGVNAGLTMYTTLFGFCNLHIDSTLDLGYGLHDEKLKSGGFNMLINFGICWMFD